jgi:hypothetical protein
MYLRLAVRGVGGGEGAGEGEGDAIVQDSWSTTTLVRVVKWGSLRSAMPPTFCYARQWLWLVMGALAQGLRRCHPIMINQEAL